jgi:DNA-binding NarL/FixJ family response regulator
LAQHGDSVSVVIIEDHLAVRRGLELLLEDGGISVIGTADDAEDGQRVVAESKPDVAIVDIGLPGSSGLELTRKLLTDHPDVRVLIYTGLEDPGVLARALDSGAPGVALKAAPAEELIDAIRAVARGETHVDERLQPLIAERYRGERVGLLSPREREVLDLLAQGLNGEEVAARLILSPETVRTHVRNAMDKLEANTRVHAVAIALRQGEI